MSSPTRFTFSASRGRLVTAVAAALTAAAGLFLLTERTPHAAAEPAPPDSEQYSVTPGAEAVADESALQAVLDLYFEEAAAAGASFGGAGERTAFRRVWLDRLAAVAAGSPPGPVKLRVLHEVTTLAHALGDVPSVNASTATRVAEARNPADRAGAMLQRANALTQLRSVNPTEVSEAVVLAAVDAALSAFDDVPAGKRSPMMGGVALQLASRAAELRAAAGDPVDAAADLELALRLLNDPSVAAIPETLFTMQDRQGERTELLSRRAAREAEAGAFGLASSSIAEQALASGVPETLVAFEAAKRAGLGGAGGTLLLEWFEADVRAGEYATQVRLALAFALDDAGRDLDALPILIDLHDNHEKEVRGLFPAAGRAPHAVLLARLNRLYKSVGANAEAAAVERELRELHPEKTGLLFTGGSAREERAMPPLGHGPGL